MKKLMLFLTGISSLIANAQPDQDKIIRRMCNLIEKCARSTGATNDTLYDSRIGRNYKNCIMGLDKASLVVNYAFHKSDAPWFGRDELVAFRQAWDEFEFGDAPKKNDEGKTITDFNQCATKHLKQLFDNCDIKK